MKKRLTYLSRDRRTKIHAIEWIPSGEIQGILMVCHGMVEHIARYDEFASYLAAYNILVVGQDLLGHGKSVREKKYLGYFSEGDGNQILVDDLRFLQRMVQKKYPHIPCFFMGHSMGSFLVRQYMGTYSEDLSGVILMGTGFYPTPLLLAGRMLCQILIKLKGSYFRSRFINQLAMGSYNRHFKPNTSKVDWVTSERIQRVKYKNDPYCNFVFTVNGYDQMFAGMIRMNRRRARKHIRNTFPLLLVSGKMDAVGNFGKGVKKISRLYQKAGLKDVRMILYPKVRHEIIMDRSKHIVYQDILSWLRLRLNAAN